MFLLDTNVISELRRERRGNAHPAVVAWGRSVSSLALYISVITVQELEIGVRLAERRQHPEGKLLRSWLDGQVLPSFAGRTLPVTLDIVLQSAALHVPDPRPVRDTLIASTALVHGLTVVTRNTPDFDKSGVRLLDPWE